MDGWMDVCLDWVEKEANNSVCAASLKYSQHDHMSVQRERERKREGENADAQPMSHGDWL